MAWPRRRDLLLASRQRLAGRHPHLPLDQILAGDHLGHRMLDLQPRVHLDEVEVARLRSDELDRAGADIVDRARRRDRGVAERMRAMPSSRPGRALPRSPSGGGAGSSNRARTDAPACRDGRRRPAPRCGAGAQIFLEQHPVVAEGRRGLARAESSARRKLGWLGDDPHALAAAAGDRLDQHRIADQRALPSAKRRFVLARRDSRAHGTPARSISALAAALAPMARIAAGGGPMKTMPAAVAGFGEIRVLGQEAVAGMDRLRAARARRIDDARDRQIALARRRRPDQDAPRRPCATCSASASAVGIDRDGARCPGAGGADDPAGDLAAIGDQDLSACRNLRRGGSIACTCSPANMPKMPSSVLPIGALRLAEIASASTRRVSAGSMMPSSHSRALA